MRVFKFLFLLFALPVNCVAAEAATQSLSEATRAIDTFARKLMEARGTPGLTLAVTTDQSLLYAGTYGHSDLKAGIRVDQDTLFQIGSISKSFTAIGLLQLLEKGIVDLEEPVQSYLPWFEVQSRYPPIHVHHLLTHSAGLPANRDNLTHSPLMVVALRDQETAWPPGERFFYSNVGYQTLHFILERLADRPYGDFIQTNILDPLGMSKSRPIISLESRSGQAVGYIPPYDDRPHHVSRPLAEAPHFEYRIGDGSIQSTAKDVAAYIRMLLNNGQGPTGRLISAKAFERFSTAHIQIREKLGYGYGIRVAEKRGSKVLEHSGGMVGFSAYLQADLANGIGAVVLANGPSENRRLAEYAIAVVEASMQQKRIPDSPLIVDPTRTENAAEYVARYAKDSKNPVQITSGRSQLYLESGDERILLEWRGKDTFYTPHPSFDRYFIRFLRDDSGRVNRLTYGASIFWRGGSKEEPLVRVDDEWSAFAGRYRSYSPWLSYFEIFIRQGDLIAVTGEGGESSSGEIKLVPIEPARFRVGVEDSPETIVFKTLLEGKAMEAVWSGHPFFRTP